MITTELLKQYGFKETYYPDNAIKGPFWAKKLKVRDMPYAREHIAGDDLGITDDTDVVVEVTPHMAHTGSTEGFFIGVQMTISEL